MLCTLFACVSGTEAQTHGTAKYKAPSTKPQVQSSKLYFSLFFLAFLSTSGGNLFAASRIDCAYSLNDSRLEISASDFASARTVLSWSMMLVVEAANFLSAFGINGFRSSRPLTSSIFVIASSRIRVMSLTSSERVPAGSSPHFSASFF